MTTTPRTILHLDRTHSGRAWMLDTSTGRTYRESLGPAILHAMRLEIADDGSAQVRGSLPGQMLSLITLRDPQVTRGVNSMVVRDDRYVIVMAEFHPDLVAAVAELGVAAFG